MNLASIIALAILQSGGATSSDPEIWFVRDEDTPALIEGQIVELKISGYLPNGVVIMDGNNSPPIEIKVGERSLVPGLHSVIPKLSLGDSAIVITTPEQTYGANGNGPIPPGANVRWSIEVVAIKP